MATEHFIQRYRGWYAKLLRLHSGRFHERFGESMAQTFTDMLRERASEGRRLFPFTVWMFFETFWGILREHLRMVVMKNKDLIVAGLAAASLLLVPMFAMLFTDEVAWGPGDFAVAGFLLVGASVSFRLVTRKSRDLVYRAAVGLAIAAALLLIWTNLAVGLIGSEGNLANLMYLGVLAVGLIGVAISRFQPRGMAGALLAMAGTQILITAIALIAGLHRIPESSIMEILMVNAFFVVLFAVSALLFRHAASGGLTKA